MDIVLIFFRHVKIDDAVHIVHVNASGGHVGGNQNRQLAGTVTLHRFLPLLLADISVEAFAVQARPLKIIAEPLAHMLGIAKYHDPLVALAADKPQGHLRLLQGRTGQAVLVDIRPVLLLGLHSDLYLVALIHPGNGHDFLGNGGREEAQVLPVFHLFNDPGHIFEEAHIQHPVRLIQNNSEDFIQADGLPVIVVHEPPRGGHHDLRFLFQCLDLAADARAAVEHRHPDILIVGQQSPELIADLNGQFPGRRQDQALDILAVGINVLDHRNAEGKGLTGTGGCLGNDILPL